MALKDHSLDDKIIKAARSEFMEYGFRQASLHRLSNCAGITTGALYTRYKNKDELFCSLVSDLMSMIAERTAPAAKNYYIAKESKSADDFSAAMEFEKRLYLELLFEHYEECTLFFCKSDGSSIEVMLHNMLAKKTEATVEFLQGIAKKTVNANAVRMLMSTQFHFFRELLESGLDKDAAVACMETVEKYNESGWRRIFEELEIG